MTEQNLEALTREYQRQIAVAECKNVMGRSMYYGVAWLYRKLLGLWSQREDCQLSLPWGSYTGRKGVERCYLQDFGDRNDPGRLEKLKGIMMLYTIDTPIIEVAADGQSAKGVWISSGCDTWRENDEHPKGYWRWGKYLVDFLLEDGCWKIWHMTFYPFFLTSYDQSWTQAPAYDYAFFKTSCDRPRDTPVYHYGKDVVYPDDQPSIPTPYECM